jgi:hypothetical protein
MKNRAFVGQPILAAAVFQAAFSRLRAGVAEGHRRRFFDPVAGQRARRRGRESSFPFYERRRQAGASALWVAETIRKYY